MAKEARKSHRNSMTNYSMAPSETGTEGEIQINIKHGKKVEAAWGLFSDYCNNSTIHGMKYLGERKRPLSERIWWVIAFSISLYGCGRLILNVWNKWDQSPVIVSFAEKSTPVWQIPFPAITICPETKAKQGAFNFTRAYHRLISNLSTDDLNEWEIARLGTIVQVCDDEFYLGDIPIGNETVGKESVEYLRELAPTLDETFKFCQFGNNIIDCKELFSEIITEEGLCYSFNILNSNELYREFELQKDYKYVQQKRSSEHWSLENGYTKDSSIGSFPVRVLGAGAEAGIYVYLNTNKTDIDYVCGSLGQGYKVHLHTPGEVPQVSKQFFRVPFNQEMIVSVKPNMMTTSEGLRHYAPSRRQCFFNKERDLKYFKEYTQKNCELECLSNYTIKLCGCVKFSMPRSQKIPICGPAKMYCFRDAETDLLRREFQQATVNSSINHRGCNCLPACTSIVYDAETSQATFDLKSINRAYKLEGLKDLHLSVLSIFFKENQFITSKRSELYGQTDFLANCGGLLGLFMGVSILSLVEIIYYLTIRLFCNLYRRRKEKKAVEGQLYLEGVVVDSKVD